MFSTADCALAKRIEAGHAASGMAFAQATATRAPSAISAVEAVGGGWAIFQGIDLPMTQALSVGMNGPVTPQELDRLEAFFHDRGSPAVIDLCSLADPGLLTAVQQRGYLIREISNVLARRLDAAEQFPAPPPELEAEPAGDEGDGGRAWASIVARGFMNVEEAPAEMIDMLASGGPTVARCYGLYRRQRVATGAMDIQNGLATLFADATLSSARGKGMQLALIQHRLAEAAQLGCDLASASVMPGGASHRNYERAGFQMLYARVMLSLPKR